MRLRSGGVHERGDRLEQCPDGHDPALATGVCTRCGYDLYGYYDDLDRHAAANAALAAVFRHTYITVAR